MAESMAYTAGSQFESGPLDAEIQHNDVVALSDIRRVTLRAYLVRYGEHTQNKVIGTCNG